jgi:hypothetical protein
MKLIPLGSNKTVISFLNGLEIFFSYQTPVAANLPDRGYVRTSTSWSQTTSRHINQWLEGVTAEKVSQTFLDSLVELKPVQA